MAVSKQLVKYLKDNDLLPDLQFAYRANHSTETPVLKVLFADILLVLDLGDLEMLTLLDLCAVFDSVDHDTLFLQISYGLDGAVINWLSSYLHGRLQHVHVPESSPPSSAIRHGVSQGSFLGPILFL